MLSPYNQYMYICNVWYDVPIQPAKVCQKRHLDLGVDLGPLLEAQAPAFVLLHIIREHPAASRSRWESPSCRMGYLKVRELDLTSLENIL